MEAADVSGFPRGEQDSDDDDLVDAAGTASSRIAPHCRLNRPVDPEAESLEITEFLLAKEAQLSRPVFTRCSTEFLASWVGGDNRQVVRVPQSVRSRFPHFGFPDKTDHFVFPEEALFLAETARLAVSFDSVMVADFQRLYSLLIGRSGGLSPSLYGLYARISRRGTRLRRMRRFKPVEEKPGNGGCGNVGNGNIGASRYLQALSSPATAATPDRKKFDPLACGAFFRWQEVPLFRRMLKLVNRTGKRKPSLPLVVCPDEAEEHPGTRVSAFPFPSCGDPCPELAAFLGWDRRRASELAEASTVHEVSSRSDRTRKNFLARLRRVGEFVGASCQGTSQRKLVERFEERVARMTRLVSVPDLEALRELHRGRRDPSGSVHFRIRSEDFQFREKPWADYQSKMEEGRRSKLRSLDDTFARLDIVPDLISSSRKVRFDGADESRFPNSRDKKRLAYEVNPPSNKSELATPNSSSILIVPQSSCAGDQLSLGAVLMTVGARMMGLDSSCNVPPAEAPLLIGSATGEDFDVLSLTTCAMPGPEEVAAD